jgi:hypothetical protein
LTYTLETNILIGFSRNYPRDLFPSLWSTLEKTIDDRKACICQAVLDELERGTDELHDWAKRYPHFVCDISQDDIDLAADISVAFPEWVREETNAADPFVVAHGVIESRMIVTDERRAGTGVEARNQKIPNVAETYGATTVNFFEFARAEGWRF